LNDTIVGRNAADEWKDHPPVTQNVVPPGRTPLVRPGEGLRDLNVSGCLRILIVTDAWAPQVNGVVRTLEMTGRELSALGNEVRFATPEHHTTVGLPTYPEIRLALFPRAVLVKEIEHFAPHAIHIATEGTMGFFARNICIERGLPFTTAFHTRYPEYIHARFPLIPENAVFAALKSFHAPAAATMVSTPSLQRELESHGFTNTRLWSRGVDTDHFRPRGENDEPGLEFPRPIFLYVGRVAVEKNIEAFLALDLPGSKLVVGEGPQRAELKTRFPAAHFLGARQGDDLARLYAASDVFVFPSRTDTYGLVLLEALASGVPVAAYPVPGPSDVIGDARVGVLDEDLRAACLRALDVPREAARTFAKNHSWRASTMQFLGNLVVRA
jgi:glycosyltransferase involved in cell wall biosynthesis